MLASYLLGVVLAIGAGIVNATGVTIQKVYIFDFVLISQTRLDF
jgi:hypothetical protein